MHRGVCHGEFARNRGSLPFPEGREQGDTLGLPQWKSKYLAILSLGKGGCHSSQVLEEMCPERKDF